MAQNLTEWTLEYAKPLITNGLERLVDSVTPGLSTRLASDPAVYDEYLAVLGLATTEAESMLSDAVLAARHSGRTWTEIADALGMERATVQARFSASTPGTNAATGAALATVTAGELAPVGLANPGTGPGPQLGDIRQVQPLKLSSDKELNLMGEYGWKATSIELKQDWMGAIAYLELDGQKWEYKTNYRKKRSPAGEGWELIDGPHVTLTGAYWRRPTAQPVRPGNPEPSQIIGGAR